MTTERKIILFTRHGKPLTDRDGNRLDAITPASIKRVYQKANEVLGDFVAKYHLTPGGIFMRHSDAKRTVDTGRASLAGALSYEPIPESQEDLDRIPFPGLNIGEDQRISYGGAKYNVNAFKKNPDRYVERWISNPDATAYEGVEVTPFNEVVQDGKDCWGDSFDSLSRREKNLGVLSTHSGIAEALMAAAVNSGRRNPIDNVEDLGGLFKPEDFAILELDFNTRSQNLTFSRLMRDGQKYNVDLAKLMS